MIFEKSSSGQLFSLSIAFGCLSLALLLAMARLQLINLCIGTFNLHDVSLCVGDKGIAGAVVAAIAALALGDREPGSVSTKQIAGYPKDAYAALPRYVQAYATVIKRQNLAARASANADKQSVDKQSANKQPADAIALIDAANMGLPIGRSQLPAERPAGNTKQQKAQKPQTSEPVKPGSGKSLSTDQKKNLPKPTSEEADSIAQAKRPGPPTGS